MVLFLMDTTRARHATATFFSEIGVCVMPFKALLNHQYYHVRCCSFPGRSRQTVTRHSRA